MSDTLRDYLNEIGKIPLLTAAEEIELGHAIQRMIAIGNKPHYTKEEQRIRKIGRRAKDRMIQGNLRLVINVATKYKHLVNRISLHDLIQEGNIGLIRAVELFDPGRGYKFSTYAYWWIRQGITRSIQVQDRIIKLPTGASDILRKVKRYMAEYHEKHGKNPSIEQCAEYADVTVDLIKNYLRSASDATSLDQKLNNGHEDASFLVDFIAAVDNDPEEDVLQTTQIEAVTQALEHMNGLHKQAMILRFGLDGSPPCSKREISRKLGIGQDTVKRLLNTAQHEMRVILREGPPGKLQPQKFSSSLIWGWG